MGRRLLPIAMVILLGCGAEVVVEEEDMLPQGEGGYLGTGERDLESAIKEACDLYSQRFPKCPQQRCIQLGRELLTVGERSGCDAQAVGLFYCSTQEADQYVCLGHHRCEEAWAAYEQCKLSACTEDNNFCGL